MNTTTAAPVDEHRFPCESCGSDYRYEPASAELVCDHCGDRAEIGTRGPWQGSIRELDFASAIRDQLPAAEIEQTRVTACPNCGAKVEFSGVDHATECPFCATPVVADTGLHRHIKPRGVLPFAFDESTARDVVKDWLGSLWFAPNGLQEYARNGRRMDGIYVPYWTYDAQTKSHYSGERGTIYYETQTVMVDGRQEQRQVQRIRWRHVTGRVQRFFDDVLVLGSKSLPKKYTDALEPWDLAAMEPYRPEFLAGFRAEGYAVDVEEGYNEARQIMARIIERDVRFDIGGDRQRIHDIDTDVSGVTFKHILLPVWLAAYKYRGKTYRFVVNGRTGRVQGERPWSGWKIAAAVLAGVAIAAVAGYLYAQYGG